MRMVKCRTNLINNFQKIASAPDGFSTKWRLNCGAPGNDNVVVVRNPSVDG